MIHNPKPGMRVRANRLILNWCDAGEFLTIEDVYNRTMGPIVVRGETGKRFTVSHEELDPIEELANVR